MGKNVEKFEMRGDSTFGKLGGNQMARITVHPDIRSGKCLNLGCGFTKWVGPNWVNVDKFDNCEPDMVVDLDMFPYPWEDETFDYVLANHVMEHLVDWWKAFVEIARILKVGGNFEMRVPDESSSSALTYRDHYHVFSPLSFHGIGDPETCNYFRGGTNAWAKTVEHTIPLNMKFYHRVPHKQYSWMRYWPFRAFLMPFCAEHMRNFIWEQQFIFEKYDPKDLIGGD